MEMLRTLLQELFGFVPEDIVQTNSIGAQLLMVRSRHGVAIVPGFIKETEDEDLVRFPLPGGKSVKYNLIQLAENDNPIAKLIMDFGTGKN